ncbi:hypothetical protein [Streptomyces sp. NPDC059909]|uniref:hypothetical protein n=1 Tax=Streptomyces sp. NPDC059909 TaxID=3346998 RepID=UPI0036520D27
MRKASDQAALKVLALALHELITRKARDINHVAAHWKTALNQFSLFFEDRLNTDWNRPTRSRSRNCSTRSTSGVTWAAAPG